MQKTQLNSLRSSIKKKNGGDNERDTATEHYMKASEVMGIVT